MSTTLQSGTVLDGKYRLLRRIGEGGMGTVFEGENIRIKRKVAIKVLHEHVATSPEFAQRFVREARASARIGSAHVCDVLDLGDLENGEKYIVMELLDGESLEDNLERIPKMSGIDLAPIAFEMLEGLGAMHQVGVVHRDLKPANVFLCKAKGGGVSVKILDFGVAKIEASEEDPSGVHDMTTTGTMMGTPLYMSPEQARGARDVDGRTDLYAASVIFYRALTGEVPHQGMSLHELLFKIVLDEPKPIRDLAPEVDADFARIVSRGLERDPDKRYTSARLYQEEIAAWGKAHGLDFKVTLPSEPPPLRKMTGGFPAAQIELVGPALRSGNTPVSVRSDGTPGTLKDAALLAVANTQASVMPPEPPTMQSPAASTLKEIGGPLQPSGSNAPLAPLPISSFSQSPKPKGDTLLAGAKTPAKEAPKEKEPPKEEAAPPPKEKPKAAPLPATKPSMKRAPAPAAEAEGSSKTMYVVGAVVVIAAAIVGVKLGGASRTPDPVVPSAVPSAPPPPPASTSAPAVPVTVPTETPSAVPDASSAQVLPNTAPAPQPVVVPKPSAPAPSAPVPVVGGHVIRTDAGF